MPGDGPFIVEDTNKAGSKYANAHAELFQRLPFVRLPFFGFHELDEAHLQARTGRARRNADCSGGLTLAVAVEQQNEPVAARWALPCF